MAIIAMYASSVPNGEGPTTGYLLWRLTMRWRAAVDRALAHLGLTHAQYSVLASLYGMARGGARPSQRELADHTGLDPIYVSKLARSLDRSGLVDRTESPRDPRAVQLSLTQRGTRIVTDAIPVVRRLQDDMTVPIGGASSRRHREFARTLQALLHQPPGEEAAMIDTPTLTGQDIGEAEGAMTALLERALAPSGRSRAEYITLRVLAARGPFPSDAELIDFLAGQPQLGLHQADAVALLDRLRVDGLATAEPTGLSVDGRSLLEELSTAVAPVTRQVFSGFDDEDLAVAHRVLTDLIQRARTITSAE